MSPSLSIVIPAYNESARLGHTLPLVFAYLNENFADAEQPAAPAQRAR